MTTASPQRPLIWLYFGLSLSALAVLPLGHFLAVTSVGARNLLWIADLGYKLLALAVVPLIPITSLFLFWPKHRRRVGLIILLLVLFLGSVIAGSRLGWHLRVKAFEALAQRSAPLVEAISAYERDLGKPPEILDQLVPRYLSASPVTTVRLSSSSTSTCTASIACSLRDCCSAIAA